MHVAPLPPMTIVPLKIANELLNAGVTHSGPFYLVYAQAPQRFFIVWWERLHWHCSCTKGKCVHTLAVNTFLIEEVQTCRITGDEQITHVEDNLTH